MTSPELRRMRAEHTAAMFALHQARISGSPADVRRGDDYGFADVRNVSYIGVGVLVTGDTTIAIRPSAGEAAFGFAAVCFNGPGEIEIASALSMGTPLEIQGLDVNYFNDDGAPCAFDWGGLTHECPLLLSVRPTLLLQRAILLQLVILATTVSEEHAVAVMSTYGTRGATRSEA